MSPRLRIAIPAVLATLLVVAVIALSGGLGGGGSPGSTTGAGGPLLPPGSVAVPSPSPTPRPEVGGLELYGYLPYWRMNDATAAYVRDVPLSTIALFSVGAHRDGSLRSEGIGYQRIVGPIGRQIIADAHARKARVELVFTSFGERRNSRFFFPSVVDGLPSPRAPVAAAPGSSALSSASAGAGSNVTTSTSSAPPGSDGSRREVTAPLLVTT